MARFHTYGHANALGAVQRAVLSERPPHALLIVGPAGVGKTTLALDLAAGLLCLSREPDARPCRECSACRKVEHDNHPDLHRLAPEGAGDQIRLGHIQRLTAELALLPMEGRWRVAVIEAAHRLNPDAQNALLKTLEEPVGAACIILAADDPAAILPTVASRAARLRVGPVPQAVIAAMLQDEGVADASRAASLARAARGRPGLARSLASQPEASLVADRLARSLLDLSRADARTRLGAAADLLSDAMTLESLLGEPQVAKDTDGPASGPDGANSVSASGRARRGPLRPPRATSPRAEPAERRRATIRVLTAWRDVGRDLVVVARGGSAQLTEPALLDELRSLAPVLDEPGLLAFLERLDALVAAIEEYADPALVMDALLLAWPRIRAAA